jgi:predicted porin
MFKKTVMAAAIAAVASAPAMAAEWKMNDGDTKFAVNAELGIYIVDGYVYKSGDNKIKGDRTRDTILTGVGMNQLEFKGSHQINDDVKVFGEIEIDFNPAEDNGELATDDFKLGISSKNMGQIMFGQFDSYYEDKVAETLDIQFGENFIVSEPESGEDAQHFQFKKSVGDLTFAIDGVYSSSATSNGGASNDTDLGTAFTAVYKAGSITLAAGFENIAKYDDDGAAADYDKSSGVGLTYKMGDTKLHALYAQDEETDGTKQKYSGVGVELGMGNLDLAAAYQKVDKDGDDKRNEWYAGMQYEMYKDMHVYLETARFDDTKKGDGYEMGLKYEF